MTDEHDDLIRDALRADAEGVAADDDLLARIRAAARADRSPWRRPGALLLAAAAVIALVVGLAVLLTGGDDEQSVDLVDDPQTTSTTEPLDLMGIVPPPRFPCSAERSVVAQVFMRPDASEGEVDAMADALEQARSSQDPPITSIRYVDQAGYFAEVEDALADRPQVLDALTADMVPSYFVVDLPEGSDGLLPSDVPDMAGVLGTATTQCDDGAAPSGDPVEPPGQAVAVTEQGRVVVIDTATGAVVRDLGGFDDPTDPAVANREGGAFSVTGVALHPNGRDVYVETCCEPAAGSVFRVPVDGSAPLGSGDFEPFSFGYGIDISADGRWLAYVAAGTVAVLDLETGDVPHTAESGDGSHEWVQAAINADGSVLAIERVLERSSDGDVVRSDARTTNLTTGEYEDHEAAGGRFIPLWVDGGRMLVSVPAPGEELRDANVDRSGVWILVVTDDGRLVGRSETAVEIPGGPYLAADW